MARFRTARPTGLLAAAPLAAALLLAGAAAAQAAPGVPAGDGSSGSAVSATGSGNVFGRVDGNTDWAQQTATGSGASNQDNTLGVRGNSGQLYSTQNNLNIHYAQPAG
ncbi:hypothetical protein [Streptacidiphilus sp. ASG 303]|uniref:hypothetical protein n=1 Tax=Streptomycetaceae TaxID=2062 RepID=UPI001E59DE2F|nr:hypothetical protein [Streptacidiphilus sp. ASG 303]MCD0482350.1 hypothetical protein [Streptacidiphilus sp. ASG 303]